MASKKSKILFSQDDFNSVSTRQELLDLAVKKGVDLSPILEKIEYEAELKKLQAELVNLQKYVRKNKLRVAILFEGRDASGKGGSIKRFVEHLNPRSSRVVGPTQTYGNRKRSVVF